MHVPDIAHDQHAFTLSEINLVRKHSTIHTRFDLIELLTTAIQVTIISVLNDIYMYAKCYRYGTSANHSL